jgi:hypothetical protein
MRAASAAPTYPGADPAGTEFWLSGPHVYSLSGDDPQGPLRHVCAVSRFNRRNRSGTRMDFPSRHRCDLRRRPSISNSRS